MDTRLIERRKQPAVRNTSTFVAAAHALSTDALEAEYRSLVASAPARSQGYLWDHDISKRREGSNRLEELLAHRWYANGVTLVSSGEPEIELVDFQFPLKAKRSDYGVGKVDLLGVDEALVCIELKVLRPGGSADNPLAALLELLSYCAVVEANKAVITQEVKDAGFHVERHAVSGLLLGSGDYWDRWDRSRACTGWRKAIRVTLRMVEDATGVIIKARSYRDESASRLTILDALR